MDLPCWDPRLHGSASAYSGNSLFLLSAAWKMEDVFRKIFVTLVKGRYACRIRDLKLAFDNSMSGLPTEEYNWISLFLVCVSWKGSSK